MWYLGYYWETGGEMKVQRMLTFFGQVWMNYCAKKVWNKHRKKLKKKKSVVLYFMPKAALYKNGYKETTVYTWN